MSRVFSTTSSDQVDLAFVYRIEHCLFSFLFLLYFAAVFLTANKVTYMNDMPMQCTNNAIGNCTATKKLVYTNDESTVPQVVGRRAAMRRPVYRSY